MAARSTYVTGIASIDRKLAALEKKVAGQVVRTAMRAEANTIKSELKATEPEGPTKALKRSIIVRSAGRSRKGYTLKVGYDVDRFKAAKWHATFSEWGTHKMRGDHAMKRTYEHTKRRALRGVIRRIRAGLKEIQ